MLITSCLFKPYPSVIPKWVKGHGGSYFPLVLVVLASSLTIVQIVLSGCIWFRDKLGCDRTVLTFRDKINPCSCLVEGMKTSLSCVWYEGRGERICDRFRSVRQTLNEARMSVTLHLLPRSLSPLYHLDATPPDPVTMPTTDPAQSPFPPWPRPPRL